MNKPLVTIVGPTGIGKSKLANELAQITRGEIVNADSRQVYQYLDIGTAKPSAIDFKNTPHHLFDIILPNQIFNIAEYQQCAYKKIDEIQSRSGIPYLVGGTGQYVWSVLEGWCIPRIAPDWDLRKKLEVHIETYGKESLFQQLQNIDASAAREIHPNNTRRIIRALEIRINSGQKLIPNKKIPPTYNILVLGLTTDRQTLYNQVDSRIDKILEKGFIEEVKSILDKGFPKNAPAFKSVGYEEALNYIEGKMNLTDMINKIKTRTHKLIRQQYNWFRLNNPNIHWLDLKEDYIFHAAQLINSFIESDEIENGFY